MQRVLASYAFTADDWCELAQACLGEGQVLRAGSCFRNAVELRPQNPALWVSLALCQSEAGFLAQAVKSLRMALNLDPRYTEARLTLVRVLLRQGKQVDAFRVWWDGRKRRHSAP